MLRKLKGCVAVAAIASFFVTAEAAQVDTWEDNCKELRVALFYMEDGLAELVGDQSDSLGPNLGKINALWAALYMPKTAETRSVERILTYSKESLTESLKHLGVRFVDRGEGYLELADPLLGVSLLLSFDWPHLNRVIQAHTDLLDALSEGGSSKVVSRKDRDHRHFPAPLAMVHMDKMTNKGGKVNYGVAEHDGGYCVGMLRDLLTFSLTRTRILEGLSEDTVEYRVEEIKVMMRKLMSYMKGSISDDDFASFCGKGYESSETSKFEKALYAGLEIAEVGTIMTAEDEKIITDVWALIEQAVKTRRGIPVAEIKSWGRKLDDLFGRLGAKVGLEIPSGVYGPQFGVWADYTANSTGVYYFVSKSHKPFIKRGGARRK